MFHITKKSRHSSARCGLLNTWHGRVRTPCFMPVATRGAVKTLAAEDMTRLTTQIILSNTYHLWQRPGLTVIEKAGGLHRFMRWSGPILTDSGGYQVFSLARRRNITERGVTFISELDGRRYFLTPEKAITIQRVLGSDIMMSFDECPPHPASRSYAQQSLERTIRWARRGLNTFRKFSSRRHLLFGIVQGSVYRDLRLRSAEELVALGFDGYAVGGVAVGEPPEAISRVVDWVAPKLPADKPRYLMGVGQPRQIVQAIRQGIDMFDCVIPTRNARHGLLFIFRSAKLQSARFYEEIRIKQSRYIRDMRPLDIGCDCLACRTYTRAYLRHLFMVNEPLAIRLATLHNVRFYMRMMQRIRRAIRTDGL